MKKIICILIILAASCSSKKKSNVQKKNIDSLENIKSFCPENGICKFEILKNKQLNLLKDGIGQIYPKVSSGNTTVYKFTYTKNIDKKYQDSHYSEEVYFELPKLTSELEIENNSLKKVKLLFARLCFCRGQTGYYKINEGKLMITKQKTGVYKISLSFKTNEVPQVITLIKETIKLK